MDALDGSHAGDAPLPTPDQFPVSRGLSASGGWGPGRAEPSPAHGAGIVNAGTATPSGRPSAAFTCTPAMA